MMWDDLTCSNCGDPAVILLGGGSICGDEVERAACERCRQIVFEEVIRSALAD